MTFYTQQKQYYESLQPQGTPTACFAGDLVHYLFAEPYTKNKLVLEAGCGKGYGAYHIASNGANNVIAIDISDECLCIARQHYSHPNLEFHLMDVTNIKYHDRKCDVVLSFEVLEHLPASLTHKFMQEIKRVLKKTGKFIISTPNRDVYSLGNKISKTKGHINELSAAEFITLMNQYFKNCEFYYQFKYNKKELELKRQLEIQRQSKVKKLSWRRFIPPSIKSMIKNIIKPKTTIDDVDLISQMYLWEVKPIETIKDLELSVVQIAVCTNSLD